MFLLMNRKGTKNANCKIFRIIFVWLAAILLLSCAACSNGTDGGNSISNAPNTSTANPEATESNAIINTSPPDDSDNAGDNNNISEPDGADKSDVDLKEVARAYREILEATEFPEIKFDGGVLVDAEICIKDICGNGIPELLYILKATDDKKRELHIWTYNMEPMEILSETIIDTTQKYGAGSYGVVTSNDSGLYIYQSGSNYQIYYRYDFSEKSQQYVAHSITSSSVIKYMRGFDIFDGYSTEGWDDLEKYGEQEQELFSNIQYFLFQAAGFLDSSPYQMECMSYKSTMEYLDNMENGNTD